MRLEAKNVSFRYNERSPWILREVTVTVEEGERVGLIGPSGYGKSTLLRLMGGYLKPASGEILLDGKPLEKKGISPVQLIYQHPEKAINPRWKMKKVLEESGMFREEVMEALGIEKEWLGRYPRELSGGELQRFCVARSLFQGTHFLLADEMSTMLDVITQAQIWNLMVKEVQERNIGLLMVTHNKALAKKVCTRCIDLREQGGR
ncbi:ABC transporter ATP-binding protein [Lactonifactor longoviformis]|uniref:Peptide/nickel transport system ATP-binding protein n=1 Tax=Lactonifactor longoviformis DSM 17459 TaxID=1122155 RepID=A0A1M4YF35_9CLOT|nr:ATP-binding cassette domain-containing protein [Lactonifactor longoviformis]POP31703.1 ABC transporter ATP-binding protein [Lactonifactor longoviformis]SHF04381.1 peptide/nickel transport system ATP-binding protein [Lactonifactor longoviformis DSM 17459]